MVALFAGPIPLHGLGGAQDLPIPLGLAIAGGTAALIVSFCVLALAWRRPRYAPVRSGRPVPTRLARLIDSTGWRLGLRIAGLVFFGWVTWALVAGLDRATNPALGTFYVLVWVGIVPFSLLFGRMARALSPVRTLNLLLAGLLRTDPGKGVLTYPGRLGYWPAAAGLFAFVWQELVNPNQVLLDSVRLWLAVYVAIMLIGAAVFGDTWLSHADPFEVYSDVVARLSPWSRDDNGRLVWRSPLAHLATMRAAPGMLAVLAVLFGSTVYDSFKDQLRWTNFVSKYPQHEQSIHCAALALFVLVVGVTFTIAARTTSVAPGTSRSPLPALLAYSIVPIIVGYMTAHYLSYFVEQGQATIQQLSDPLVRGDDYLGTAGLTPNLWLSLHPGLLATSKVLAVVIGHILGATAAHDRALTVLPKRHEVIGQLGMLVVMVAYTGTGLFLLFSS